MYAGMEMVMSDLSRHSTTNRTCKLRMVLSKESCILRLEMPRLDFTSFVAGWGRKSLHLKQSRRLRIGEPRAHYLSTVITGCAFLLLKT